MLRSLTALDDYTVIGSADGGHLGRIRDSYFDDRRWSIRHLVVETGHWPGHHRRLLSPWSVRWLDAGHRVLQTDPAGARG